MYSSVIVDVLKIVQTIFTIIIVSPLFKKFKMIVYENDSTDNTIEILEQFKKHIHILIIFQKR